MEEATVAVQEGVGLEAGAGYMVPNAHAKYVVHVFIIPLHHTGCSALHQAQGNATQQDAAQQAACN